MLFAKRDHYGDLRVWKDGSTYLRISEELQSWDDEDSSSNEKPVLPDPDLILDSVDQGLLVMELLRGPMGHQGPMGPMGLSR